MQHARRLAHAAARRSLARDLLARLGPALTIALAVGLFAVATDRLLRPVPAPWWLLVAAPVALALGIAALLAARARRGIIGAAAEVDDSLELRDRLSSALSLSETAPDDPFVRIAARDADELAMQVNLRDAMPIRLGATWVAWPLLAGAAVALGVYVPALHLLSDRQTAAQEARRASERVEAAAEIAATQAAVERRLAETAVDPATAEQLAVLDRVAQQLAEGGGDPDEARSRAASALDELAHSLDRDAAQAERRLDAVSDRLRSLDERAADASPLADALRRADPEAAREAMADLERRLDQISPEERERVAAELERLAGALDAPAEPAQEGAPPRPDPRESLVDRGVPSEDADRLAQETDRDAIRDELRDAGVDPETAERLADEIARENQEREAREQAEQDARDLRDAMREAAEDLREPPPPPADETRTEHEAQEQPEGEQAPDGRSGPSEQSPEEPGDERSPDGANSPEGEKGAGEEQQQQPSPGEQGADEQPGDQPTEDEGAESAPGEQSPAPDGPQPEPSEGGAEPGGQPQPEPARQDSAPSGEEGAQPSPGEQRETPGAEQSREGAPPTPGTDEQPGEAPSPGEQPSPGAEGGQAPQEEQPRARGMQRLREKLDEIQREREGAEDRRQDAEQMRQRAREMLDRMSPEERERMRQWAEQQRREDQPEGAGAGAGDSPLRPETRTQDPLAATGGQRIDDVDARRPGKPGDDEQVLAEWFSDSDDTADRTISQREFEQRVREAVEAAERAVEEQPLHPRHSDLIRRYFRRLPEVAPPAEAAKDLPEKK